MPATRKQPQNSRGHREYEKRDEANPEHRIRRVAGESVIRLVEHDPDVTQPGIPEGPNGPKGPQAAPSRAAVCPALGRNTAHTAKAKKTGVMKQRK